MGFCESVSKIILIILNIAFFVLGAAVLGVGIWLKVDKSNFFQIMRQIKLDDTANAFSSTNTSALNILALLLIIIGAFTFITGFCGCCGAIKESQCLLYTYAFLVSVVVLLEIAIAIYAAVQKSKFENNIKQKLSKVLAANYNGLLSKQPNAFTLLFSSLMIDGKCCGVKNIDDFNNRTAWANDYKGRVQVNSVACCQFKDNYHLNPDKAVNVDTLINKLTNTDCPFEKDSKYLNTKGCIDTLESAIKSKIGIVIGICFGIGLFEILCIVFACCVARKD